MRWVGYYGEQLVYTTSSGQTVLHTAEGREPLARFSHWLYDDRYLIGLHEGRITAWDQEARSTTLLNDAHSYDWIYYGERLLAEVALRIADAAGTWLDEDGMRLVIRGCWAASRDRCSSVMEKPVILPCGMLPEITC